jgi:hypothetical protein
VDKCLAHVDKVDTGGLQADHVDKRSVKVDKGCRLDQIGGRSSRRARMIFKHKTLLQTPTWIYKYICMFSGRNTNMPGNGITTCTIFGEPLGHYVHCDVGFIVKSTKCEVFLDTTTVQSVVSYVWVTYLWVALTMDCVSYVQYLVPLANSQLHLVAPSYVALIS